MKRIILITLLILSICPLLLAEGSNLYTFIVNIVHEPFGLPLIGFVNIHEGSHNNFQIGFINRNTRDFSTAQTGFVNSCLDGNLTGAQTGFVNYIGGHLVGAQTGFLNVTTETVTGFQTGFINSNQSFQGVQVGFINNSDDDSAGVQAGFLNRSINFRGTQVGFLNIAQSIENGIPIGFLSIIREGGYRAIEIGFSEYFPLNIGIKLGMERFYTNLYFGHNPRERDLKHQFATGVGFGTLNHINENFYSTFELNTEQSKRFAGTSQQLTTLTPSLAYKMGNSISITVGPSLTWVHNYKPAEPPKQTLNLVNFEINDRNSLSLGINSNFRVRF